MRGIRVLSVRCSKASIWLFAGLAASGLAACSPTVEHRGYMARPGAFEQIGNGMPKSEVESILGSPSTTASVKLQGDSYYYITSTTESRAFLTPKETSREVIAVRFDGSDQVASFGQYGLEDGRVINISSRQTPVVGVELTVLQQIFRGILNASPAQRGGAKVPTGQ